jgi:alanine racemase
MTQDGVTATIDLQAIADNYRLLQRLAGASQMTAVVKANGYGLGMETVSRALQTAGCRTFYTAQYSEAVALRALLPEAVIAPLNGIAPGAEKEARALGIVPIINDPAALERMRNFARFASKPVRAVLHMDTGMNRLGFSESEWEKLKADPALLEGIEVGMVMSHLACSDEPDHPLNELQRARFEKLSGAFPNAKKSFANSHGVFLGRPYHFDQCRAGRALWGTAIPKSDIQPKPVLRLTAPVLQVRRVDSDGSVGYGATHPVTRGMRLATLAAGYADGVLRNLSNPPSTQSRFFIDGHPAPLVGRVSMDLIVVDVTEIPENLVHPGVEVEITGPMQSIDDLAAHAGTIGYELLTHIAARVQRRYLPLTERP